MAPSEPPSAKTPSSVFPPRAEEAGARLRALEARVRLLRRISACFTAHLDSEQVIEEAVQTLSQEFPEYRARYGVIGPQGRLTLAYGPSPQVPAEESESADLSEAMEYLRELRSGAPVCVVDVHEDERMQPIRHVCDALSAQAILQVPVRHSEDLLGVLSLISSVPCRWTLEEQETLQEAAHQMTLLIQASRQEQRRRVTEEELLETTSRLKTLMDSLDSGILFEDQRRTIVYANQAFCELCGKGTTSQVLGGDAHSLNQLLSQEFIDQERFMSRIQEVLRQKVPVLADELVTRGGRTFERDYRPVERDGRIAGHLWHYRDVSKRKQVQHQLALGERMAALGTLAAGVAHEINNPLMYTISNVESVISRIEALQKRGAEAPSLPDYEGILEALRDALMGSQRVREVVRDLDSLGRDNTETKGIISVNDVIESSVRMTRNEVRHRARLVLDLKAVPSVSGAAGKLSQVVVNLLCNAAHAIPVGRAEENEVRISSHLEGDGRVVIRVADTGLGIPNEIKPRIFEPFFTSKSLGKGMGLGLAICHQIVADMGGEIRVESEVGMGTEFEVRLPIAQSQPPFPMQAERRTKPVGLRILLVDDDAFVMRSLTRILRDDHQVVGAASGREALEAVAHQDFDVILCDLMMPNLSGMELYEILGDIRPGLQQRMAFVTGGAFSDSAHDFLMRTAQPVLRKPFQRQDLDSLLARFVRETERPENGEKSRALAG